jgi:hypothetical protein
MVRSAWLLVLAVLSIATCLAATPASYVDSVNGFRIVPPAFEANKTFGFTSQPVTFAGPISDAQAPSCNVQIQNMGLTPPRYRELSLNQFKAIGLTVDSDVARKVSGKDAFVWRYSGKGVKAVALAVFVGEQAYLVTCMAASEKYPQYEETFDAAIDSFSLEAK